MLGSNAASGGFLDETQFEEIGLVDIGDSIVFLGNGCRQGFQPYRASSKFDYYGLQYHPVHIVQTILVYF